METYVFKPQNVCSREMKIDYENGIIKHAEITGGCHGNLLAICRIIEGMEINKVIKTFDGIKCRGSRTGQTSCSDQLAQGLKKIL